MSRHESNVTILERLLGSTNDLRGEERVPDGEAGALPEAKDVPGLRSIPAGRDLRA